MVNKSRTAHVSQYLKECICDLYHTIIV